MKQGIRGPPQTLLLGNILEIMKVPTPAPKSGAPVYHDLESLCLPFYEKWKKQYGDTFVFALGTMQILHVNRPDLVREITTSTSFDWYKPSFIAKEFYPMLGNGIVSVNGPVWAHQRKIIAPELYMGKVKGMISMIQNSASALVKMFNDLIEAQGGEADLKVDTYLRRFSGDVISRACFGSTYSEGEQIFNTLRALQEVSSRKGLAVGIPGYRYIPTKSNMEGWALQKEIRKLILKIVERKTEADSEKNLLQMILQGAKKANNMSPDAVERFLVDNCKNIYFGGYETTAITAAWCLMLLATNQEWQNRVRDEVLEVCKGGKLPDYDSILNMKQLTMVINETLRLYPPVAQMSREATRDIKLGDIHIPKGVQVWSTVTTLHTDPEIWGPDSFQFKPDRFANGTAGACKFPHLYMPFGFGPRLCLGMNLALIEMKVLLSLILSKFSVTLSPKYVHSPVIHLFVDPKYGVDLVLKKLQ